MTRELSCIITTMSEIAATMPECGGFSISDGITRQAQRSGFAVTTGAATYALGSSSNKHSVRAGRKGASRRDRHVAENRRVVQLSRSTHSKFETSETRFPPTQGLRTGGLAADSLQARRRTVFNLPIVTEIPYRRIIWIATDVPNVRQLRSLTPGHRRRA